MRSEIEKKWVLWMMEEFNSIEDNGSASSLKNETLSINHLGQASKFLVMRSTLNGGKYLLHQETAIEDFLKQHNAMKQARQWEMRIKKLRLIRSSQSSRYLSRMSLPYEIIATRGHLAGVCAMLEA
uniref:AlNc14C133G7023 protein n=1 Tax=Albugo laibachii Nc14 TaxID=890382 RepID=F0WKH3_9STRA|nr:AlNc14C133G7023 [Albugo laibachii Nc14]|eukprot:CCA21777.1 AlNc14C133G7023 [Albugo laibachii Nc14]